MSDQVLVALIVAATGIVVAIIGVAANVILRRLTKTEEAAVQARQDIVATKDGVFEIGRRIDGRLDELLASTKAASHAEGVAAGEQSQRDRSAPADLS